MVSYVSCEDMGNGPMFFPGASAHWSMDNASTMSGKFSPQIKGQFHKTKLCAGVSSLGQHDPTETD